MIELGLIYFFTNFLVIPAIVCLYVSLKSVINGNIKKALLFLSYGLILLLLFIVITWIGLGLSPLHLYEWLTYGGDIGAWVVIGILLTIFVLFLTTLTLIVGSNYNIINKLGKTFFRSRFLILFIVIGIVLISYSQYTSPESLGNEMCDILERCAPPATPIKSAIDCIHNAGLKTKLETDDTWTTGIYSVEMSAWNFFNTQYIRVRADLHFTFNSSVERWNYRGWDNHQDIMWFPDLVLPRTGGHF